jgi:hypothetical protein
MSRYILRAAIDEDARADCCMHVCNVACTVQYETDLRRPHIVIKSPGIVCYA